MVTLLIVSGCGQAAEPSSTTVSQAAEPPSTTVSLAVENGGIGPEAALTQLFEVLSAGDYAQTEDLVDEAHLGLLAAIEVSDATAYFKYEQEGLTPQARNNFWSSFAASMTGLLETPADEINATIERQFAADGTRFAIGKVRLGIQEISGDFVLRLVGDEWRLDPIATFGGAFVAPIRNWLRVIPSADVAPVSELLRRDTDSWRLLADLQTDESESGITISSEVAKLLIEIGAP